jgi:hypothetical protein
LQTQFVVKLAARDGINKKSLMLASIEESKDEKAKNVSPAPIVSITFDLKTGFLMTFLP